jgi:hypothetical protein
MKAYESTQRYSCTQRSVEMNGRLHVPSDLPSGEETFDIYGMGGFLFLPH